MRYFVTSVILMGFFLVLFSTNPAQANFHAKIEAARAQLASVSKDNADRGKIEGMNNKAAKFQGDKKKKNKCNNILKKAVNLMGGSSQDSGGKKAKNGGGNKCADLIKEVEGKVDNYLQQAKIYGNIQAKLMAAKQDNKAGKTGSCVKAMKWSLSKMR